MVKGSGGKDSSGDRNRQVYGCRGLLADKTNQCTWRAIFRRKVDDVNIRLTTLTENHTTKAGLVAHEEAAPSRDGDVLMSLSQVPGEMQANIMRWSGAGCSAPQIRKLLLSEPDGPVILGDGLLQRIMTRGRHNATVSTTAQEAISILNDRRATQDPDLYIKHAVDSEGRLNRLFWMTGEQRRLWRQYSDVALDDTTFGTNLYGMPLHVIVGVDRDGRSRILATAVITTQLLQDHAWVFEHLKVAGGGKAPDVMFTDGEAGIIAALEQVFPNTAHFLCIWHIAKNLKTNLAGKLGAEFQPFMAKFFAVRGAVTHALYKVGWGNLLQEFPAAKPYLMSGLGLRPAKWAAFSTSRRFTAGIMSAQRVESINHIIKGDTKLKRSLPRLIDAIHEAGKRGSMMDVLTGARVVETPQVKQGYKLIVDEMREVLSPYALRVMYTQMLCGLLYHTLYRRRTWRRSKHCLGAFVEPWTWARRPRWNWSTLQ